MVVEIKINGIPEAQAILKAQNYVKLLQLDKAIHDAGGFLLGEVVSSIAGQRAETRSVDTGRFMNSVTTDSDFTQNFVSIVQSEIPYADHLEFGTSRMVARKHFRNSANRNETKILEIVKQGIK